MTKRGLSNLYFKLPRFIHFWCRQFRLYILQGDAGYVLDVRKYKRIFYLTRSHEFDSCHGVINLVDYSNIMIQWHDSFFVSNLTNTKLLIWKFLSGTITSSSSKSSSDSTRASSETETFSISSSLLIFLFFFDLEVNSSASYGIVFCPVFFEHFWFFWALWPFFLFFFLFLPLVFSRVCQSIF